MNKREQRQIELTKHYERCAKLAALVGGVAKDGKKVAVQLLKAERLAHSAALMYCNGEINDSQFKVSAEKARAKVLETLGGFPHGFFVNSDPRGYALKIDDKKMDKYPFLHRDWGGYGILSPEI